DAIELRLIEPDEELTEFGFGLAGKPDDERAAQRELRALATPGADAPERILSVRRTAHALQYRGAAVLEGNVEVRQYPSVGHQRNHGIDVRERIDIVQAHPHSELAQSTGESDEAGFERFTAPAAPRVAQVRAVGARVLGDDQQLLDPRGGEPFGFAQHLIDRATDEPPAHRRNDAEAETVVAPFGDFQVRVVSRREPHTLRRHEVEKRVVSRRQVLVHRAHHLLVSVRPRHLEYARVALENPLRPCAEAPGDDDSPVLLERFADRLE